MQIHGLILESRAVPHRPHLIADDLVIDGGPLREHIERATGDRFDLISPLGWQPSRYQQEYAARLIGAEPARLSSGRCELLVCPECGDLGCGCVSCRVARIGPFVVWSELGWEADHDPSGLVRFPMGSFRFRADELARTLRASRAAEPGGALDPTM